MDWPAHLAAANTNLATFRKADPDTAAAFTGLHAATMQPGALDVKTKELMCLAIGIARECTDCVGFHAKAARRAGATREEFADTVAVTIYMGGGPAFMYGAAALEAYDQLA